MTTYANWVAKVSSLLADELDVEHGSRLLVDLPAHWLGTSCSGPHGDAGSRWCWDGGADVVVTGPAGLERWAGEAHRIPVVASALQPLAGRFADGVPGGVHDLGVEVWSQPDAFVAFARARGRRPGGRRHDPGRAVGVGRRR